MSTSEESSAEKEGAFWRSGACPTMCTSWRDSNPMLLLRRWSGGSKRNPSKWLNEQPRRSDRFQWQAGYGAFSVSESRVSAVRAYVQNQREHHARVSLRDELIALLEKNRIQFDERYLLG